MRLTRKLYSEPDEEVLTESEENADPEPEEGSPDDGDATPATEEELPEDSGQIYVPQLFWYEIYNVLLYKTRKNKAGQAILSKSDAKRLKTGGTVLGIAGTGLSLGSEIKRRKLKKNDENKA